MIQLTQQEYDRLVAAGAEAERLKSVLAEVHAWAVCAPIASPDDMAQNFPRIIEITSPDYTGRDPIRALIAKHAELLKFSDYTYFELARTRRTEWMAWLCSDHVETNPDRKVIAKGQGQTPDEACRAALDDYLERNAQSGKGASE